MADKPTGLENHEQLEVDPDFDPVAADSAASSAICSTASLSESIFEYRKIHGRTFQKAAAGDYWAPNDDQQNEGLDLAHHFIVMALGNKLSLAPLGPDIQRVLDVGTGTGIWACDFADENPDVEVIGTDISPIQSTWVPPNVRFLIDDCLLEWTWQEDFDFIHLRGLHGSIPSFTDLYINAWRHLKPGGWIQCVESDVQVQSDHVEFPPDHAFNQWANVFREGGEKMGRSFDVSWGHNMKNYIEQAGFVDVVEKKIKTPLHGWAKDPHLKKMGFLAQAAIDEGIEGYGIYFLTEVHGWSREEALVLIALVRREIRKVSYCPWFWVTVVYARKPFPNEPANTTETTGSPTNAADAPATGSPTNAADTPTESPTKAADATPGSPKNASDAATGAEAGGEKTQAA